MCMVGLYYTHLGQFVQRDGSDLPRRALPRWQTMGILGHRIEEDAAVGESRADLIAACQGHDGIGANGDIASSTNVGDDTSPASGFEVRRGQKRPRGVALDFDIRVGEQAGLLTNICGDSHLTLGFDTHAAVSLLLPTRVRQRPPESE